MAPAATETTTTEASQTLPLRFDTSIGAYKDLQSVKYSKEAELKGGDGFKKAKVSL